MPTPKQIEEMAARVDKNGPPARALAPGDDLPPEYWQAIFGDVSADRGPPRPSIRTQRLAGIQRHLLRVSCCRCARTVEIQKVDAVRLYGRDAVWRDVSQRLLDNTCTLRTGRHEEDGCWPQFE
ncbi:hypothetical protein ACVIW2_006024 [Bradyrhizobium huanghuaihaiense]